MKLCGDIELKLLTDSSETERPVCQLQFQGRPTTVTIKGAVLEACVECEGHYLLFVTDDIPHEEALYFYLLDADFITLDSASLGAAYSTGHFRDLSLQPPRNVLFQFIGGTRWSIEILAHPRWRVPFLGDPKGVMHNPGFRRYFVLRGNPLPGS